MRRKINIVVSIMLLVSMLALSGCGDGQKDTKEAEGTNDSSIAVREFTDDCGRTVEIPEDLTQIVPSGSLAQIVLYAVAPDTLVAIPEKWSEEAKRYVAKEYIDLPEIGSFFGSHDLNYEEIAKLSPQLVVDVGEYKSGMEKDLEEITKKTGIPAVHITANYDDMDLAFKKLGELFGKQEEAKALSDYCATAYRDVEDTLGKVRKKKRIMYCTQENGLNVLAKDSYHSQIIDLIGDNVSELADPSSQGSGNEVNLEQMLVWDPEVIIFAPESYYDKAANDSAWASLSAIRNGKYYEVPSGPYNWMGSPPSSNRILGMLWMTKVLYPDQAEYDMKEKAKEYYKQFYHYELSDEEYDKLIEKSLKR